MTAPNVKFGRSERYNFHNSVWRLTPSQGPKYKTESSFGKQRASTTRTAPSHGFGTSTRDSALKQVGSAAAAAPDGLCRLLTLLGCCRTRTVRSVVGVKKDTSLRHSWRECARRLPPHPPAPRAATALAHRSAWQPHGIMIALQLAHCRQDWMSADFWDRTALQNRLCPPFPPVELERARAHLTRHARAAVPS